MHVNFELSPKWQQQTDFYNDMPCVPAVKLKVFMNINKLLLYCYANINDINGFQVKKLVAITSTVCANLLTKAAAIKDLNHSRLFCVSSLLFIQRNKYSPKSHANIIRANNLFWSRWNNCQQNRNETLQIVKKIIKNQVS